MTKFMCALIKKGIPILFWSIIAIAEAKSPIVPLNIGDRFPESGYEYLFTKGLDTAELKGKLLIFGFGASYCAPCISSLRKMEKLNETYASDVVFIMITNERREKVNQQLKSDKVTVISEDTLLHHYFPHLTEPHIVWVDSERKITAYTSHHALEDTYLDRALRRENLDVPIKWDFPYDYKNRLGKYIEQFREVPVRLPDRAIEGTVSSYLPGVRWGSSEEVDSIRQIRRVWAINLPLSKLIPQMLGLKLDIDFFLSQFELSGNVELSRILYDNNRNDFPHWEADNVYSYDYTFPIETDTLERAKVLLSQISEISGLNISFDNRWREVIVIRKGDSSEEENKIEDASLLTLHSLKLAYNTYDVKRPMILDMTKREGTSNYVFLNSEALIDIEHLMKQLEPQGYFLEVQDRMLLTINISDEKEL